MTEGSTDEPVVFEGEIVAEPVETARTVPGPHQLGLELPDDPDQAVSLLLRELADARADADGYLDDLRRLAADFDNYRKRTAREQAENVERASERVVRNLLPVLDSFDAAFAHEPQTPTEEKLIAGMRSTYHQLFAELQKEGLEVIPAPGEPFDPEIHEAVSSPPADDRGLLVVAELRRGYRLKGRVVRAALVALDHADDA